MQVVHQERWVSGLFLHFFLIDMSQTGSRKHHYWDHHTLSNCQTNIRGHVLHSRLHCGCTHSPVSLSQPYSSRSCTPASSSLPTCPDTIIWPIINGPILHTAHLHNSHSLRPSIPNLALLPACVALHTFQHMWSVSNPSSPESLACSTPPLGCYANPSSSSRHSSSAILTDQGRLANPVRMTDFSPVK